LRRKLKAPSVFRFQRTAPVLSRPVVGAEKFFQEHWKIFRGRWSESRLAAVDVADILGQAATDRLHQFFSAESVTSAVLLLWSNR